jgi:NAD(P)-dependent dehydrogenase (short-subunit alcohol dehydrogenase family)
MANQNRGKIVVMSGATSGIGLLAARMLAAMGVRLILVARDRARAERALSQLAELGPDQPHRAHYADLSRLAQVKRVADEISASEPRIDVVVNNAGNIYGARTVSDDGLELTFATNHVAPFVLTCCLRNSLIAATPARIINTASDAHLGQVLDFSDLQMRRGYRPLRAYGRSKLCNILFTRELARRLAGTGVTANCLHPGFVRTNLGQNDGRLMGYLIKMAMLFAGSPERGAETLVHLATAPQLAGESGGYYYGRQPRSPSPAACDDASAKRLWEETARLTGVDW